MAQELKQLRVKIFDELSAIVDPEINVSITELELIDEVDIQEDGVKIDLQNYDEDMYDINKSLESYNAKSHDKVNSGTTIFKVVV